PGELRADSNGRLEPSIVVEKEGSTQGEQSAQAMALLALRCGEADQPSQGMADPEGSLGAGAAKRQLDQRGGIEPDVIIRAKAPAALALRRAARRAGCSALDGEAVEPGVGERVGERIGWLEFEVEVVRRQAMAEEDGLGKPAARWRAVVDGDLPRIGTA